MMVEIFCGILAGSSFGKNIRQWRDQNASANLGQCFVAIDPECFAPLFTDRLDAFLSETRGLKASDALSPVLTPGDPERMNLEKCKRFGGVVYGKAQIDHLNDVAARYDIRPLTCKRVEHNVD
jgi:LDH2 family malate/lactate/ureidoglycolate dehydrogenase